MLQDLEYLIKLQEIDLRIKEQELAQEQFPAAVSELENEIKKAESALQLSKSKLNQAQTELKTFEEQILHTREQLDKSQSRLNSIKTNREYDAVHAEIEAQKNMLNTAEQRRKNLDEEINRIKASVDENTANVEKVVSENEPKIADLKQKIGTIDSNIAEIMKERNEVVPKISKPSLRTYDLIRKKRKTGKALSLVSTSKTCTVCYKVLEPQLYNEIRRGNRLTLCQSCGSILIWDEHTAQEQKTQA